MNQHSVSITLNGFANDLSITVQELQFLCGARGIYVTVMDPEGVTLDKHARFAQEQVQQKPLGEKYNTCVQELCAPSSDSRCASYDKVKVCSSQLEGRLCPFYLTPTRP